MLTQITINNFVLIKHLSIELNQGLIVVTGESGAGKSIIMDALHSALGARINNDVVRTGAEKCDISLHFDITEISYAKMWLAEHDYASDDECIIRRVITKEGKSRSYINGQPCTLQQIKEIAQFIIHMHGQHQHQQLSKRDYQRELLDHYAKIDDLTVLVQQLASQHQQLQQEIVRLQTTNAEQQAQFDLLSYQVNELNELGVQENEYQQLDQQHKQLSTVDEQLAHCQSAINALESEYSCSKQLYTARSAIDMLTNSYPHLKQVGESLEQAAILTDEAQKDIEHLLQSIEPDPEALQAVEQRLSNIHSTARKHHVTPDALVEHHQELINELNALSNVDEAIIQLENDLQICEKQYQTVAKKLTDARQKAATILSTKISEKIQELNMQGGKCEIHLVKREESRPHIHGNEIIEIMVQTNPGMPLASLAKVASGGELSRLSLAIHVVTAAVMSTPVLVFDEVDVGIGGITAAKVAKQLDALGQHTQVICITHLPQVAATGHQHLMVVKHSDGQTTETTLSKLDQQQRVEEIARMLGGEKITDEAIANATSLLS